MAVVPDNVILIPDYVGDFGETIGPVDYGCVRRYRHRRLATYLWLHGFRGTLRGLVDETEAFMSAPHLSGLVQQGLWDDAIVYLSRFLRPASEPQSDEVQVLLRFLTQHRALASIVAGGGNQDLMYLNHKYNTRYLNHDGAVSHDDLRMRSIVLSLLNSPQVRASLDWERVRQKASQIVHDLVFKAPELRDLALLPRGSMMPHDVLPIGFRSRQRHYVKEQDLPRAKSLARVFLRTRKRLPSSTRSHELNTRLTDKARKWVVDFFFFESPHTFDESLQAGRLELQSSGKKAAPVAAVSQTVNLTSQAENSGISAMINAGVPGATVSHTMSNAWTDLTRNYMSGTSSLSNSGALVAPVSQIMSGTLTIPSTISGAPVAAVSQTVNLTSHAENSGISAAINAD
ncbi:unnamed protein product [Alopecurus aequalis]